MTVSLYAASVPVFQQMLGGLSDVLAKAAAHAAERKIDPDAYLQSRLYPDMFPLLRQVQVAADFAKSVSARLAGVEVPAWEDSEKSFADLQSRIARTLAFIAGLDAAAFEAPVGDELDRLPGVGPATAASIVTERERNGPFASVADLERVPGIGPAKLAAVQGQVVT